MAMTRRDMVEQFVCPGCVAGGDTSCGSYKTTEYGGGCKSHVCGTSVLGLQPFALGLPKGFNKCAMAGNSQHEDQRQNTLLIRLWTKDKRPEWNKFNVPVWALAQDGFLFVRTLAPRIGKVAIDVIEGGSIDEVPQAIDVGAFVDELD